MQSSFFTIYYRENGSRGIVTILAEVFSYRFRDGYVPAKKWEIAATIASSQSWDFKR